ncbi:MAG: hypothetical protein M1820_005786 [Bogoriella megaspora]|nr:MAG: hypothetical protein M1820_005786 [Bogoriella megaspora]
MTEETALHGSCACGRNLYRVSILHDPITADLAQVYFDSGSANRRHQAAPVTAWLRVPLTWYESQTHAFYPDETHSSIRRTFTSPHEEPDAVIRRQFCGYCGTQLSSWNERTREDADFISLTLGSLVGSDLERLVDLGLLPDYEDEDDEEEEEEEEEEAEDVPEAERQISRAEMPQTILPTARGFPWFESVVEDSRLGRIKRQKGGHTSRDGLSTVEWEVVEIDGSTAEARDVERRGIKRKNGGEAEEVEDVLMGSS